MTIIEKVENCVGLSSIRPIRHLMQDRRWDGVRRSRGERGVSGEVDHVGGGGWPGTRVQLGMLLLLLD